ncbi:efflux RND transporter periplasmic adaptor subunit [Leptospira vanthielii]|nr:efflux RND transporter periplasmic adaptor subunit [Leptospira vanthielii]
MKNKIVKFIILVFVVFGLSCADKGVVTGDIYTCPMHPQIEMDHEGECPICGMTLVKKEPMIPSEKTNGKLNRETPESFSLSEDKQRLIGIETSTVAKGDIVKNSSFSGKVGYDPDLYSTYSEYRSLSGSIGPEAFIRKSARLKITKLGLSESQIQYLNRKSEDILLTGRSKNQVLIFVQVYEGEINQIVNGTPMEVKADSIPNFSFQGRVVASGNLVDETTRTLSVWCEVTDPANRLKPQMYVQSSAKIEKKNVLRIPREAVFPTGKREIVYVKQSENRFGPRSIQTGFVSTEWIEVLEGLVEGEEIVSKANFLLDSEAKLKLGGIHDTHNH